MREINKTGNEFIFTRFIYTDDFHAICLYRSKRYESFFFSSLCLSYLIVVRFFFFFFFFFFLYVVFLLYVLLLYCILYVVCFVCSPKLEEIKESIKVSS